AKPHGAVHGCPRFSLHALKGSCRPDFLTRCEAWVPVSPIRLRTNVVWMERAGGGPSRDRVWRPTQRIARRPAMVQVSARPLVCAHDAEMLDELLRLGGAGWGGLAGPRRPPP